MAVSKETEDKLSAALARAAAGGGARAAEVALIVALKAALLGWANKHRSALSEDLLIEAHNEALAKLFLLSISSITARDGPRDTAVLHDAAASLAAKVFGTIENFEAHQVQQLAKAAPPTDAEH